nr:3'-5' exoribonuclease [Xanthomonas citri]
MRFFLDTEWADPMGSELVSIGLVSEDGVHRFYAERAPLPDRPTDFVQHVVYPLLQGGSCLMSEMAMTGRIWVSDPITKQLIEVPALDSDYARGLTRWQHNFISETRKTLDEEGIKVSLSEARARLTEMIEEDMRLTKRKQRQRHGRFLEKSASTTKPEPADPESLPRPTKKRQAKPKAVDDGFENSAPAMMTDSGVARLPVRRVGTDLAVEVRS